MNTAQVTDPVKYPTVTINGKKYPVKFRFEDLLAMETAPKIERVKTGATAVTVYNIIDHLAIALRSAKELDPDLDITPEGLMKTLEFPNLKEAAEAIALAMGKATAQAPSVETTPATQVQ